VSHGEIAFARGVFFGMDARAGNAWISVACFKVVGELCGRVISQLAPCVSCVRSPALGKCTRLFCFSECSPLYEVDCFAWSLLSTTASAVTKASGCISEAAVGRPVFHDGYKRGIAEQPIGVTVKLP
jgi:hypothetical protein